MRRLHNWSSRLLASTATEASGSRNMSVEICEESRSLWRRELAAQALWQIQGPLRMFPQAHGEEDNKYNFMGALHSMISDGFWDLDQLLQESDQYLELVGSPESEKMSVVLRRSIDAL